MTTNLTIGSRIWSGEVSFYEFTASAAGYPVSNLSAMPLSKVWRSTDTALENTRFGGTLSQLRRIENLWLCNHNLSPDGKVRRRLYRNDGNSPSELVHDSGWRNWLAEVYTFDQVDHDGGNLHDRTYTAEELAGQPKYDPYFIDGQIYADEFVIEIDDPLNPDGFVQVGYCAAEQAAELSVNPEVPGCEFGYRSRTRAEEAESGHLEFDRLDKPRQFAGIINHLPFDEAKGVMFEQQRQLDIDRVFTVWPNRDDSLHTLRDAWLGRNAGLPRLSHQPADRIGVPFNYEEVIG